MPETQQPSDASLILPPAPLINRRWVLCSALGFLLFYLLLLSIAGWSIYHRKSNTSYDRLIGKIFPLPAVIVDGEVIPYNRYTWEVAAREQYDAAHHMNTSQAATQAFVVNQLINQVLYSHILQEHHITVTTTDVNKRVGEIENQIGGEAKLRAFLKDNYGPNIGLPQFNLWIRDSLDEAAIQQQLLTKATVRHIVIKVPQGASDDDVAAAKQRTLEVKAKITSTDQFAQVAKDYSDDIASRDKGGSLGTTVQGELSSYGADFEKAIFSIPVGQVSDPIHSPYGWHLVIIDKREGSINLSLDALIAQKRNQVRTRIYVAH